MTIFPQPLYLSLNKPLSEEPEAHASGACLLQARCWSGVCLLQRWGLALLQKQKSCSRGFLASVVVGSDRAAGDTDTAQRTGGWRFGTYEVRTYRTHKHTFQLVKQCCMLKRSFVEWTSQQLPDVAACCLLEPPTRHKKTSQSVFLLQVC